MLVLVTTDKGEDLSVLWMEELDSSAPKGFEALPQGDKALDPPEQGTGVVLIGLHVDRLVVIFGIDNDREVEPLGIGVRETSISVTAPLHGRAHAVTVTQVDIIPHPYFVPVVEYWRSREGKEEALHEFDLSPLVPQKGCETASDPQVDPHLRIVGIGTVHIVPLLVRDHLQGQLIVIAKEERPLARLGNRRRLFQHVDDGSTIFHSDGDEHPGHHRKVEGHMGLVSLSEVSGSILGPLVGLGQQHWVFELPVYVAPQLLQEDVSLGQVLAVRPLPFIKVRHGIKAKPIHAEF